ncbi:DUF488 domain-containing protein [Povalibacter sp.]|uniref:DUF488 domain-containing protein n=1 Tax=Povalibacter sp. TaxID=1962978 RepID=UPI002F3F9283
MIRIKRTYDPATRNDGKRFLVERLWPRGMRKDRLAMDAWLKEVAPSTQLRQWFGHRPGRWAEFRRRYQRELNANPAAWLPLVEASKRNVVTLLYSAHDVEHNGAVVLRDYLAARPRPGALSPPARPSHLRTRKHSVH